MRKHKVNSPDHHKSALLVSACGATVMKDNGNDISTPYRPFRRRTSSVPAPWKQTKDVSPTDDDHVMRLRTFTIDPKAGLINRGDSYRSLNNSSRSESYAGSLGSNSKELSLISCNSQCHSPLPSHHYNILVLGGEGVGKTVTINQFMTSDYCNLFNNDKLDDRIQNTVYVRLDEEEFELTFVEVNNCDDNTDDVATVNATGYIVLYSVDDRKTLKKATEIIHNLRKSEKNSRPKPIVLVGNKIDLERKRITTTDEGKSVAKENSCKFIEISVAIGHKVDELLVGIVNQVRQQQQQNRNSTSLTSSSNQISNRKCLTKSKFYIRKETALSCLNFSSAGKIWNKFVLKNRRCSKSVEDLLSLTF